MNYLFLKTKTLFLILLIISIILLPRNTVRAATLNPGSNFVLCTAGVTQPMYTSETSPTPTLWWTFTSAQSDYNDGVAPPADPTPNLAATTQGTYWIEVSPNSDYSSPVVQTAESTSTAARSYKVSSGVLSFGTRYYWRIKVKDAYNTISDWANGESFLTNKPSIKLKGSIKLKNNIRLK